MSKFVPSYAKFKSSTQYFNKVYIIGDYIVIQKSTGSIYFALATTVTSFTDEAIKLLNGYCASNEMWNTLCKAKSIILDPVAEDKSEVKAVVNYDTYSSEVSFIRMDSEVMNTISTFFRTYLLNSFSKRSIVPLNSEDLDAFLSVATGTVIIKPIRDNVTDVLITDSASSSFMLCSPYYEDNLFIEDSFRIASNYLANADLVDSIDTFLENMKKYNASIVVNLPDTGQQAIF